MAWIVVGLLVFLLLLSPMIGIFSQPLSSWWFQGAAANPPGVVPAPAIVAPQGPLASDMTPLMEAIRPWMGVPYVFGGNGLRGVDCSGLTVAVYRQLGYSLPRTAQTQYDASPRVAQPEVGDMVFFERTYSSPDRITHVGIVVDPQGRWMVSAAEPAVGRQSYGSGFWASRFAGFGRVR